MRSSLLSTNLSNGPNWCDNGCVKVEIGPVSRESASAWLDYADRVVASLRGIEADKAPPEVLDAFESVLAEWREAMEEPGEFHWVSERPSEEVGFMLNALYEAGLAVEAAHEMGAAELRPAEADEFHYAVVNQSLAWLEAEGGPDSHLVAILREHWGVADG